VENEKLFRQLVDTHGGKAQAVAVVISFTYPPGLSLAWGAREKSLSSCNFLLLMTNS
jgi:hypothetical protein